MSLPKFDPWSHRTSPNVRAYRAYCAYPSRELGALSTIGTGVEAYHCNSLDARMRTWLALLEAARTRVCGGDPPTSRHGRLVIAAIDFCRSPWAGTLFAMGWQEGEVFAIAADQSQAGGFIQQLNGGNIRFATAKTVYFGLGSRALVFVRGCSSVDALPRIWDLPFEGVTG